MSRDLDIKIFLNIITIQCSCLSHLSTIGQIKKFIAFFNQSILNTFNHEANFLFSIPDLLTDLSKVLVIECQAVPLHLDLGYNLPQQIQRNDMIDSIFCKEHKFLYDFRRSVLKVLEGYRAEDGFQSSSFVFGDTKEVILMRELLFKSDSFVIVIGSHEQVGHISNLYFIWILVKMKKARTFGVGVALGSIGVRLDGFFIEFLFIFSVGRNTNKTSNLTNMQQNQTCLVKQASQ